MRVAVPTWVTWQGLHRWINAPAQVFPLSGWTGSSPYVRKKEPTSELHFCISETIFSPATARPCEQQNTTSKHLISSEEWFSCCPHLLHPQAASGSTAMHLLINQIILRALTSDVPEPQARVWALQEDTAVWKVSCLKRDCIFLSLCTNASHILQCTPAMLKERGVVPHCIFFQKNPCTTSHHPCPTKAHEDTLAPTSHLVHFDGISRHPKLVVKHRFLGKKDNKTTSNQKSYAVSQEVHVLTFQTKSGVTNLSIVLQVQHKNCFDRLRTIEFYFPLFLSTF